MQVKRTAVSILSVISSTGMYRSFMFAMVGWQKSNQGKTDFF
jgi:hypothetical protein